MAEINTLIKSSPSAKKYKLLVKNSMVIILPSIMFPLSLSPPWYLPAKFLAFPEPWTSQLASHSLETHRLDGQVHVALNVSDSGILFNALFSHCGCFDTVTPMLGFSWALPSIHLMDKSLWYLQEFSKEQNIKKGLGILAGSRPCPSSSAHFLLCVCFASKSSYSLPLLLSAIFIQSVIFIHSIDIY